MSQSIRHGRDLLGPAEISLLYTRCRVVYTRRYMRHLGLNTRRARKRMKEGLHHGDTRAFLQKKSLAASILV